MASTRRHALLLATVALACATAANAQVALGRISGSVTGNEHRKIRVSGYVAVLDLGQGAMTPVVTGLSRSCRLASNGQVSLLQTGAFDTARATFLAITANSGPALPASAHRGSCGVPSGLIVSDGALVNPGETNGPVLYFPGTSSAVISDGPVPAGVRWAVAGSTYVNNDCPDLYQPGTLLVKNGAAGVCPIPKSGILAGRGAAGVDSTGTLLFIVVVTGSEGATGIRTADLATLLIGLGARNAVNFDGGGSTVFYWTPSNGAPRERQDLVARLESAAVPAGVPNPGGLSFTVRRLDPTQRYVSDANHRAVYASLGFVLTQRTR